MAIAGAMIAMRETSIAVALCIACGAVDALGFLQAGVFAANMTGNTVLTAISLAELDFVTALDRAMTVLTFFLGAMLGRLFLHTSNSQPWFPLAIEALLICFAAVMDPRHPHTVWVLASAMGIQATAMTKFRGATVSTIVLTSTMARLAESALDFCARKVARAKKHGLPTGLLAATWAAYAFGAIVAVVLLRLVGAPLLVSAAIVLIVAWVSAPRRRPHIGGVA